jgi:hypothetical protein
LRYRTLASASCSLRESSPARLLQRTAKIAAVTAAIKMAKKRLSHPSGTTHSLNGKASTTKSTVRRSGPSIVTAPETFVDNSTASCGDASHEAEASPSSIMKARRVIPRRQYWTNLHCNVTFRGLFSQHMRVTRGGKPIERCGSKGGTVECRSAEFELEELGRPPALQG